MTDDEAFVRRIVDGPGDDLPRLVYADWLDERGDPRAAYLRAEHEWALTVKLPHTDRVPLSVPPELLRMAEELDPVWVARVSLPPLGVCCPHVELRDRGPPVTDPDIDELERAYDVTLPADYRAFLLNYNGGRVVVDGGYGYDTPEGFIPVPAGEYTLYSLTGSAEDTERDSLESWIESRHHYCQPRGEANGPTLDGHNVERIDDRTAAWFRQFITVGRNPDEIYGILLGVEGPEFGRVHYFDYSVGFWPEFLEDVNRYSPYAASFADYLSTVPGYRPHPSQA